MAFSYEQMFFETVSAVTATPKVQLGTRRLEGLNEYVYAYNTGNSQILPGDGLVASASSSGSMTLSSVTGDMCAGVVKNTTATTGTYFWACVKGPVKVNIGDTVIGNHSATVGRGIALMSDGKFYGVTTGATGSTWAYTTCGCARETIATAASGSAWIQANA